MSRCWKEGRFHRFEYAEIDHCCRIFNRVDEWLDAEKLQHHGPVGHASACLMRSRDVVKIVTEQIRLNETVFLHRQALIQNVTRPGLFTREILPHDRSQPAASSAHRSPGAFIFWHRCERNTSGEGSFSQTCGKKLRATTLAQDNSIHIGMEKPGQLFRRIVIQRHRNGQARNFTWELRYFRSDRG